MANKQSSTLDQQANILKQLNKIIKIFKASECNIRPHFLVVGPSGSGKSHTVEALAKHHEMNFVEINAAQLTKEGVSGNSLSKALSPLVECSGIPTICFVDEFDKLFISGNSNSQLAHESTNGVQNEFLKILESDTASVSGDYGKYIKAQTSNVLFVFAGAFNGEKDITIDRLREFGIKTEFLGRVSLLYNLEKLSISSMEKILRASPILERYLTLFPSVDKEVVVSAIMDEVSLCYDKNTLGVRLLITLLHQYFINGGIDKKEVKKTTFQKTLSLDE